MYTLQSRASSLGFPLLLPQPPHPGQTSLGPPQEAGNQRSRQLCFLFLSQGPFCFCAAQVGLEFLVICLQQPP